MTQHHIRKLAGWGPLRRAIERLHEPRIISAVYGAVYTIALVVGIYSFFDPPQTIVQAVNNPWFLHLSLGAISAGGLLGAITVPSGTYWLERSAAGLLCVGLILYWCVSMWLVLTAGGSRWMSLMTTTFAVLLVALRFYWINDRPFHPDRPDK